MVSRSTPNPRTMFTILNLTIGRTLHALFAVFVFADVTMVPRTICERFVATDAGIVVIDAPPSDWCAARDVILIGTTVDVC